MQRARPPVLSPTDYQKDGHYGYPQHHEAGQNLEEALSVADKHEASLFGLGENPDKDFDEDVGQPESGQHFHHIWALGQASIEKLVRRIIKIRRAYYQLLVVSACKKTAHLFTNVNRNLSKCQRSQEFG